MRVVCIVVYHDMPSVVPVDVEPPLDTGKPRQYPGNVSGTQLKNPDFAARY